MRKIIAIACLTFKESVRSKVLYSTLFFAFFVVVASALFGSVTIGEKVKVVKDFGLFAISFFSAMYAVIAGSLLLAKELSLKTIHNILSKPLSRATFLCGKFLGLGTTVSVLILLLTLVLFLFCYFLEGSFDWMLFYAAFFIFLQSIIVCACTIFFSSIVITPFLSGFFSFAFFLAGRSSQYFLQFLKGYEETLLNLPLKIVYEILPHLNLLDVSERVVYNLAYDSDLLLFGILYSVGYCGAALILSTLFFSKRDFQ